MAAKRKIVGRSRSGVELLSAESIDFELATNLLSTLACFELPPSERRSKWATYSSMIGGEPVEEAGFIVVRVRRCGE